MERKKRSGKNRREGFLDSQLLAPQCISCVSARREVREDEKEIEKRLDYTIRLLALGTFCAFLFCVWRKILRGDITPLACRCCSGSLVLS